MRRGEPPEFEGEYLFGVHPVLEALESGRRTLDRILVAREGGGATLGRLLRAARDRGVPVSHVPREALAKKAGRRAVHQGVAALVSAVPYTDPEALAVEACAGPAGVLVALEGVEDPRNLGAILRSAAAAGCRGVYLGGDTTVGLTPAAAKTSAGALERIAVAREPRLPARLRALRGMGFRVVALDVRGGTAWDQVPLEGRLVVVAGGEAGGLRRGILDACDARVSIPLAAGVESLNVSVAVAVVLFEAVRRRRAGPLGNSMPRS
jgi:23S rRNA (guanosine2251-2'-O)-methyltransferase